MSQGLRESLDAAPAPPHGADELGELLAAVNAVTTRLEASHTQLQRQVTRLTEELQEANTQLERANRLAALGEMAAGIAHEIRNPLACIRLYASMLDEDLRKEDRIGHADRAGKITAAAKVMESVVADVLCFARELRLRPAVLGVRDLCGRIVESCRDADATLWAQIAVRCMGEDLEIQADEGLVRQALTNVVRNAAEAMNHEGDRGTNDDQLLIEWERCLRADVHGARAEYTVIRIRDTGHGVSDDVVARMFNPFFTTRHTGTGLGLAIVHRIMDSHGGRVTIVNNRDWPSAAAPRGACIELLFPSAQGERDSAPRGADVPSPAPMDGASAPWRDAA